MNGQIESLAEALEGRTVDGWAFTYEYPGIFQFTKGEVQVCCTPDYTKAGEIDVQISRIGGDPFDGWDVPYVGTLTADTFVELMRPQLSKADTK